MRRCFLVAFVLALLGTSGCSTFFKDDYWDLIEAQGEKDELARIRDDPTTTFFLGVRATTAEVPYQVEVPIEHVYAESPAARAGLRGGDAIRILDGYTVRSPGDVRWVLTSLWKARESEELQRRKTLAQMLADGQDDKAVPAAFAPHWKTRIVFARDGREIESEIDLTSREGYLELRRRRVLDFSRYEQHGYNSLLLLKKQILSVDVIHDYFGVKVDDDLVLAEDTDFLPLIFGISLFRSESVPVADATRVTVICSLLQFSSRGDDVARTLAGLVPEQPAGTTDL